MQTNIEQAIADLKQGKLIVVLDDLNRENEGDLMGLIEFMTPQNINFMITKGKGLLCAPIAIDVAQKMNLQFLHQNLSDGTNFTESIDGPEATTGISAFERYDTIRALAGSKPIKFKKPGHIFPLVAHPGGLKERRGHTEATIDLAKIIGAAQVGAIVEIVDSNGRMMRGDKLIKFAKKHELTLITIHDLAQYIEDHMPHIWSNDQIYPELKFSAIASMPTLSGKIKIQEVKDYLTGMEATVYWSGDLQKVQNVRVHSQCATSEIFRSQRCDCRQQLDFFLNKIEKEQNTLLIYTHDEGRGIGLFNKINAYQKQDQGLDTVEANLRLGFPSENRNFEFPGKILKKFDLNEIRLFSNNFNKIDRIAQMGIKIERVPIWVNQKKEAASYIHTKKTKMGHLE